MNMHETTIGGFKRCGINHKQCVSKETDRNIRSSSAQSAQTLTRHTKDAQTLSHEKGVNPRMNKKAG